MRFIYNKISVSSLKRDSIRSISLKNNPISVPSLKRNPLSKISLPHCVMLSLLLVSQFAYAMGSKPFCKVYPKHESCKKENPPPPPPSEGCPQGGSKKNLIKPKSENDGNLVFLFSCEYLKKTKEAWVGSDRGRDATDYQKLPNGARVHFRFKRPGDAYGEDVVRLILRDNTELCYKADMSKRQEGWKLGGC